ncbi:hypothetical protein NKR23_g2089 [Pleurostoma richardsiae]|uniref:Uncharacterized protein n=1 Tax=Pleurostoma richardsiae TaxID=41990 RepID=A0AA38S3A7_9PEZI|nr:hypothetical protein NKR23_g2089 [Pleurostoma richardsiae]
MSSTLPSPTRVVLSNDPIRPSDGKRYDEPGVEVAVHTLEPEPVFGGILKRVTIGTHAAVPTTNDGPMHLDAVPGAGVVLPGGANIYYLDFAPDSEVPMHRTTSTDYVIIVEGTLTVLSPTGPFNVVDGKGTYQVSETVCRAGDVVTQRGSMHAWANRTDKWVRLICVVLAASPARVDVEGEGETKQFEERWLQ